ncbi:MAG: hypothetical protein RG741_02660 [Bacteroidales bacterium]|nr:hypothetical protein [Bacteroidales bacterium]
MEKKKSQIGFWLVSTLVGIFALIFIVQNWDKVTFNLLGLRLEGFGFLVFLVIYALGFVSGWLWEFFRNKKNTKAKDLKKELR